MHKLICTLLLAGAAAWGQQSTATIEGKNITVKYTPAGEKISASFHSDADLVFKGLTVSKGDYTLYVLTDGPAWQLVINLANGAKIGKVTMVMSKAAAPGNKVTITKTAALAAKIEVVNGANVGTVQFHLDKVAGDTEW